MVPGSGSKPLQRPEQDSQITDTPGAREKAEGAFHEKNSEAYSRRTPADREVELQQ